MNRYLGALAALVFSAGAAFAQTTVVDQTAVPMTSTGPAEIFTQSYAVPGGTLYQQIFRSGGINPQYQLSTNFVPASAGGLTRYLKLTDAKSDAGVPMTAAPGTPSTTVGVTRTAGTSLTLNGEATSGAAAKTDNALFELNLADSYVAGANVSIIVNCNTSGTVITAGSTTMTVNVYSEVNGVETLLTTSAAQQIPAAATNLTFTLTGTSLVPGAHIAIELVMLVTTASGAAHGLINSVATVM